MKKYLAMLLALIMVLALAVPAMAAEETEFDPDLVAAAQEEGELVV